MSSGKLLRVLLSVAGLATAVAGAQGCVADRPSRNGVFNENQYVRKDFLVRSGAQGATDPGWYMKATIVQTSTPNPLANLDMPTGAENSGSLVRFVITSDRLDLVDMRELSNSATIDAQNTRVPSPVNAWPITNVDLKYRVDLDGEKTNFYEENTELDWQLRQWVKVNFDKNDFSDIAGLGNMQVLALNKCADVSNPSATLVPNTFLVDTANDYMQWTVSVSVPLLLDDDDCTQAFGSNGILFNQMNRSAVTMNVMYSFVRAQPVDPTSYTPLIVSELDPILHKYGPIQITNFDRDPNSGLLAANQYVVRYNPAKPIVWYFAQGYPTDKQTMWTRPGGIVDQTNAIFQQAGASARLSVLNYNDASTLGDAAGPRGNTATFATTSSAGRVTSTPAPRSSRSRSSSRTCARASSCPLRSTSRTRLCRTSSRRASRRTCKRSSAWIRSRIPRRTRPTPARRFRPLARWGRRCRSSRRRFRPTCTRSRRCTRRWRSTFRPPPTGSVTPGPSDYVYQHTGSFAQTFTQAYLTVLPYITYADPMANQFVTPADGSLPSGMNQLWSDS